MSAENIPTNIGFASEVKSDRLRGLFIATSIVVVSVLMMAFAFGMTDRNANNTTIPILLAGFTILGGNALTRFLLRREKLEAASWMYAMGITAAIGILLYAGDATAREILPFLFPVLVFLVGLLLSPASTGIMLIVAAGVIFIIPAIATQEGVRLTTHNVSALFMTGITALLAVQVTGELYQITQWALSNYQKERRTNDELFDKRQQLQRSLVRAEALSQSLADSNAELERAKKAAEDAKNFRGQFLANMSHELRTPLNAIIGFSETMLEFPIMYDDTTLPPPYERDLGQIYNSGRQLLHVINDILDLAKVDAGKLEIHMEAVNPEPIVKAVVSTAKGLLGGKPVKLEMELPEDMPVVWADESRLRQVLLNLYSNACKYTDEGSITLIVTPREDDVRFSVKDTGLGIDQEFINKIFEEFQQAKNAGKDPRSGTGLGLAITRQLLDLMGGTIDVDSAPGKGSTFSFTVQRYQGQEDKTVISDEAINDDVQPTEELA